MKESKKVLLISLSIILLVVLIGGLFSYKLYLVVHYSDKSLDYSYKSISDAYKINDKLTIHTNLLNKDEYIEYNGIKIKNDFKGYESKENSDVTGNYIVYTNKDNNSYFSLGVTEPYIDFLHLTSDSKEEIVAKITYKDVKEYLEKNNVKSDLDLWNFIASENYQKNIFSLGKDIKASYALYEVAYILNPHNKKITLLEGDLKGYMFTLDNNVREVNILKNNKRYVFVMSGEYYSIDKAVELINTIVIKES